MAACGTPLVAARGGVVQYAGYQCAAGNYLVIDGKGTGYDFMYAHLAEPTPLQAGETVRTGQPIGIVGDTGDASGCHLHFEMWGAPGWYEGGAPVDPLAVLQNGMPTAEAAALPTFTTLGWGQCRLRVLS